jgi:Uncharacterized protein conserved in bacteria (DUF2344)
VLARAALDPDLAGRSQQAAWEAALAASGLPVAGLDGPGRRPRLAAAAPLGATIPGEAELLDVWLTERLPRWRVRDALLATLPADHALVDVYDVWLGEAPLPGRVSASVYRAVVETAANAAAIRLAAGIRLAAAALLAEPALPRERRKGEATVAYDLRPFIVAIDVEDAIVSQEGVAPTGSDAALVPRNGVVEGERGAITVRMTLRHDPERGVGRPEELLAALSERAGAPLVARSLVREQLVLAIAPAPEQHAARARGSRPRPGGEGPRPAGGGPGPRATMGRG